MFTNAIESRMRRLQHVASTESQVFLKRSPHLNEKITIAVIIPSYLGTPKYSHFGNPNCAKVVIFVPVEYSILFFFFFKLCTLQLSRQVFSNYARKTSA